MSKVKYGSCSNLAGIIAEKEYHKQIEAENLLKTLIDQKLISASQRKIETFKALEIAQKMTKSNIDDMELITWLYTSGMIERLDSGHLVFSEKKIKAFSFSDNEDTEVIVKELETLLLLAHDAGLVSPSNLVVTKTELQSCLQKNRAKVPHILQSQLNLLFLTRDFLAKTQHHPLYYSISKTRLEKVLEGRKHGESSSSTASAKLDIRGQLDKIVQIAVNLNQINESNLFISRPKFRSILQAHADVAPSIDQHRLGEVLRSFGYLNPKAKNPIDTFAFSEAKIRPMLARRHEMTEEETKVCQQQMKLDDFVFKTKHEELKKLLEMMVAENVLTRKQNVVNKHVVVEIFREHLKELPSLTFKNLAIDLEDYGFLAKSNCSSQSYYTFEVAPILEIIRVREVKEKLLNGSGSPQETRSNDEISENSSSFSVKEQLEMFIGYLVKGEHLSRTKSLVDKATIFDTLRQYESLFPSLKQQTIGSKLLRNEYLDVPLKSGVYHFATAKIGHIIEQFEQLGKAETGKKAVPPDTGLSKREQVDLFVEQLVRKNVVTDVDNVVAVEKIRNVLHSDNNLWPFLESTSLGLQLMKSGYLDYKVQPNTMNFHKRKIKQVANRIEKNNMAELKLAIDKVEENQELIKAMVKEDGVKNLTENEQVDYFVDLLIKAKILTESKNVIDKAEAKEMFQSYKELLPALKVSGGYESCLGYKLMRYGYLDYQVSPDTYTFHKDKIKKLIDSQERADTPNNLQQQPVKTTTNQLQVSKDEKYEDIKNLVHKLIDLNHLSETNRRVRKELVRELYVASKSRLVAVRELGYHLQRYDFIEFRTEEPGTYTFKRRKVHQILTGRSQRDAEFENRNIVEVDNGVDDLSTWAVMRTVSFGRAKGEALGSKSCCVCQKSFRLEINFLEHMQNIHGPDFAIPWQVTVGNTIPAVFEMTLQANADRSANVALTLRNIGTKVVAINKIYYIYLNQFVALAFKAIAGGTYEVQINREFFIAHDEQHSVIVFFEDDEREYIEHFYINTPKPLSQRKDTAAEANKPAPKPLLMRKVFK